MGYLIAAVKGIDHRWITERDPAQALWIIADLVAAGFTVDRIVGDGDEMVPLSMLHAAAGDHEAAQGAKQRFGRLRR